MTQSTYSPKEYSQLWTRIYSLCLQRGWDISHLSRKSGVSRGTLHQWQTGKINQPRPSTIHKLAEALGTSPEHLLNYSDLSAQTSDFLPPNFPHSPEPSNNESQTNLALTENGISASPGIVREFDRNANWAIQAVCEQHPTLFEGWSELEWDELFSTFGTGGELTEEGVQKQARIINDRKETIYQLQVVLETHLAPIARKTIEALFESVQSNEAYG